MAVREPDKQPTTELLQSIGRDMSTLVRKEMELARHEIVEAVSARVQGTAALAGAGVMGLLTLGFMALAVAAALDEVMAPWASRGIVAAGFLLLSGLAAGFGLLRMRRPSMTPEQTKETVAEDVRWAKAQLRR